MINLYSIYIYIYISSEKKIIIDLTFLNKNKHKRFKLGHNLNKVSTNKIIFS